MVQPLSRTHTLWLWLSLGIGVPVAMFAACGAMALFAYFTAAELPVTAADRSVLVTAEHTADWVDDFVFRPELETATKKRFLDGRHELVYFYHDPDNGVYIYCTVGYEPKEADAHLTYVGQKGVASLDLKMSDDIKVENRDELFRWGDESSFALLTSDGEPVGNMFTARKGRCTFHLIVGGAFYFEDGEIFAAFVERPLGQLEGHKIDGK